MSLEILCKIANVYGDILGNKVKAKEYADRAASLDPSQNILMSAYCSAGMRYDPLKYAEKNQGNLKYDESGPAQKEVSGNEYIVTYPNPANPVTTISYFIKNPSSVKLTIYSVNGQKVATLVNGPMPAGIHSVKFDGTKFASGVYLYKFESPGMNKTGKMLIMK